MGSAIPTDSFLSITLLVDELLSLANPFDLAHGWYWASEGFELEELQLYTIYNTITLLRLRCSLFPLSKRIIDLC